MSLVMKIAALYFLTASLMVSSICGQTQSDIEFLRARADAHERKISQLEQDLSRLKALLSDKSIAAITDKKNHTSEVLPGSLSDPIITDYVVKAGDVLSRIASNHQTTVTAICRENKLTTDRIVVGQKLRIPVTEAQKAASQAAKKVNSLPVKKLAKHTVQSGETLHSIAKLHSLSIDSLKASNPDVEPTKMHVGQILLLDRRAQQPSSNGLPALSSSRDVKASPASASISESFASPEKPAPKDFSSKATRANTESRIKTITVDQQITYGKFASVHGASISQLNELNGLRLASNTTLAKGSELYVPQF